MSGAVAIGLFAGLVPGPLQMLTALLLAVPLKKNVPVALIVTFYTNPFTIVPLYLLAYAYGHFLLGMEGIVTQVQPFEIELVRPLGLDARLLRLADVARQAARGRPAGAGRHAGGDRLRRGRRGMADLRHSRLAPAQAARMTHEEFVAAYRRG